MNIACFLQLRLQNLFSGMSLYAYKHHEVDSAFTERLFIVCPQPMIKTTPYILITPFPFEQRPKSNFDEFSLVMNIWITL